MYCAESPPGSGYESYNAKLTEDIWITQSQSTCYSKEENLMAAFNEDRQLEGQLRYYKCSKLKQTIAIHSTLTTDLACPGYH